MKLGFCLFNYFPYGGLQRDFLRIAELCHLRGHQIHVFTMEWQGEKPAWVNLTLIKKRGLTNHARAKRFIIQLAPLLATHAFDCVIGFNKMPHIDIYYAADSCFVAQDKYQKSFLKHFHPRYRTYAALERAVFSTASNTAILFISKKEKIKYQQQYQTPESRWHFLLPGINKNCIRPDNAPEIRKTYRQQLNIRDDAFVLLFIASCFKTKGLDRALYALSSLPEALKTKTVLLVAGNDKIKPYQKILQRYALQNNVIFLGSRDDIPELLFMADLLVHPARLENTGMVIIEALVAGLPVLATDCCGYSNYIIDAMAGKLIPTPFNQQEMNRLLSEILDPTLLKDYQHHALSFTHNADLFGLHEKAVDYIEQFIKKNSCVSSHHSE